MTTMYDSVTASHIPADAKMVAGYDTGPYRWDAADWSRFRYAIQVHIDTQASAPNVGQVLDVEVGDATPAQAPGWARQRREAGQIPTIYCNASTWPAVIDAFDRAGVEQPCYWIAKYDNVKSVPVITRGRHRITAVAKQYADPDTHGGGHFDLTYVPGAWPGVTTKTQPSKGDDEMSEETEQRVRQYLDARMSEVLDEVRQIRAFVAPPANWQVQKGWLAAALSNTNTQLPADLAEDRAQTATLADVRAGLDRLAAAVRELQAGDGQGT